MALRTRTEKRTEEGVCIISCLGSLDSSTYQELEKEIERALNIFPKLVMLDFKELDYISSIGVSVVLKGKKSMEERGGQLILANLQPQVKKVLDIIKAIPSHAVFKDVDELDAYLYRIQKKELEKDKPPL